MRDCVLGCDIGSQGVKSILLNSSGEIIAEASSSYYIHYPFPTWAEQDAKTWLDALGLSIREVLKLSDTSVYQIKAIGLDAQVDGMVAVGSDAEPLYPAIIWMDRRATKQVKEASKRIDPRIAFSITGLNLDPYHVAPKIRWFAENQPEEYKRTRYFLLPGSYVALYLTGEVGVDYSNASSTMLMDVHSKEWSKQLLECFEISDEQLAPIYPADTIIGNLMVNAAESLGLKPGIPVILGCGDEHAACLGAGVIEKGLIADIAGTAEPVCASSPELIFDETGLVETHCHGHPDQWLIENPGFVSGANYRWFRDQFARELIEVAKSQSIDEYEILNQDAEEIPPGSENLIFLPTLMGSVTPTWNSNMRGVFVGFTLSHGRNHFTRAILEGSAYALRDITDRMQELDLNPVQIRAVGGCAKGALWRQIKADVTGLPVALLRTTETTCLGAAMLALVGAGLADSLEEASYRIVQVVETLDPDPNLMSQYEEHYQKYRKAYFNLLEYFNEMNELETN